MPGTIRVDIVWIGILPLDSLEVGFMCHVIFPPLAFVAWVKRNQYSDAGAVLVLLTVNHPDMISPGTGAGSSGVGSEEGSGVGLVGVVSGEVGGEGLPGAGAVVVVVLVVEGVGGATVVVG